MPVFWRKTIIKDKGKGKRRKLHPKMTKRIKTRIFGS